MAMDRKSHDSTSTALEAIAEGYTPVPISDGGKRPYGSAWSSVRYSNDESGREKARKVFEEAQEKQAHGVGLLLGKPSGGLIDVDLDHAQSLRLRDYFLPKSAMGHGRPTRPGSHRWYLVEGTIPATRQYKMPDRSVIVELRSTGAQTVIPPSMHPDDEAYEWDGEPFGGEEGPTVLDGQRLSLQVALLAMTSVLIENWPKKGGRHEAYLNLAGGLLRHGEGQVHEFWEKNIAAVIGPLADATHDEDGADSRIQETVATTVTRIREGNPVAGFPKLGESIGEDYADMARRLAREVESLAGLDTYRDTDEPLITDTASTEVADSVEDEGGELLTEIPFEGRNPMEERVSSWAAVDLGPYLSGVVTMPEPSILRRTDGKGLFYPGRVNSLYGSSESAKTWIALHACCQEMDRGERTMFLDFEDEPAGTVDRLRRLGASDDDMTHHFRYVHPEGPLADMERGAFGPKATDGGRQAHSVFKALQQSYDPTLIVVDGMTVLYGLHGKDTNDAMATDVITSWLKSLTRGGRTTVIVIDHTGKNGGAGASPIGAHHKIAMVQGTAIRADAVERPMPGEVGRVNLVVYKDRPGAVREIASRSHEEQIAAQVVMDSTVEGRTTMVLESPNPQHVVIGNSPEMEATLAELSRMDEYKQHVLELFEEDTEKRLRTREVVQRMKVKPHTVYKIWTELEQDGDVVAEGSRKGRVYRLKTEEDRLAEKRQEVVVEDGQNSTTSRSGGRA